MRYSNFVSGFLSVVFFVGSCLVGLGQDLKRPEVKLPVVETPPVIDGDLSDKCWDKAVVLKNFYVFLGKGRTTDAVTVRAARDNEWLYFAFDIKLPNPGAIDVSDLEHDGSVSRYDSVELFFDPGTGGETYLHYMLSAGNVRAERRCTEQGNSIETLWNDPWRSGAQIGDDGWQAEIAIPLSVLAEHGSLEGLTMNIGANRFLTTLNYMDVLISVTRETSSWAPVRTGFHEPASFGIVKGLENVKPSTPFLVAVQSVETSPYRADADGGFYYNVSGSIRGYTDRTGKALVVVEDLPGDAKGEVAQQEIAVSKEKPTEFSINVPVKILSDRTAELTLRDPATGEVLQFLPLRHMADLSLMRSFVRYSYYTTEKNAQVVCELGLPQEELAKMTVVVKDSEGKTLATEKKLVQKTFIDVPLKRFFKSLPDGEHLWAVELLQASGDVAISQEVRMVKRAPLPSPGREWKIDFGKGRLLNNGKPFFPFGIMAPIPGQDDDVAELMCADLADMGFNTVNRWAFCRHPSDKLEKLLDAADKHDLYVFDYPGVWHFDNRPEGVERPKNFDSVAAQTEWELENYMLDGVKKLMHHPRLMGWYLWDEPQGRMNLAEAIGKMNDAIYEVDGYHPTQVLYIPPVPPGDLFSKNCDILGIDPYWVPGGGAGGIGNPLAVGRATWVGRRRADRDLKLLWVTPSAELWTGTRMRVFNENEQRVQTYLALINGAQAINYFRYELKSQVSYEALKGLGREMRVIGPAMAEGEIPQTVTYTPVPLDQRNNVFPDVQVALKRNPAGGYILLAANWRAYPAEVSYKISLLGKSGKVKHQFDDKPAIEVKDSSFKDTFAAMDTRAYVIPGSAALKGPVEISVDIKAMPEQTDRFYTRVALPVGGVPGKKNLLPNSGFEETSIPGMPDYYSTGLRSESMRKGLRIGDLRGDPGVGLCTENPFEGKNSLRISAQGGFLLFTVVPDIKEPTPFVFSAWVRGSGKVMFYGPVSRAAHTLTDEWQRVHVTGTIMPPPENEGHHLFGFYNNDVVWIDAIQFELGEKLTDYEP